MNYIRKICPKCRNEFVVLKKVEEKAVYCTLECLLESHNESKEKEVSALMPV